MPSSGLGAAVTGGDCTGAACAGAVGMGAAGVGLRTGMVVTKGAGTWSQPGVRSVWLRLGEKMALAKRAASTKADTNDVPRMIRKLLIMRLLSEQVVTACRIVTRDTTFTACGGSPRPFCSDRHLLSSLPLWRVQRGMPHHLLGLPEGCQERSTYGNRPLSARRVL